MKLQSCTDQDFIDYIGSDRYDSQRSILQDLLNVTKHDRSGVFWRDKRLVVIFLPNPTLMTEKQQLLYAEMGCDKDSMCDSKEQYARFKALMEDVL